MAPEVRVLAFAGSTREKSYNKRLLSYAIEGAEKAGAQVTRVDLRDFSMPLYDGDLEDASGLPEKAIELRKLFLANDSLLIASPEYNSSISGVLKNSIDWISRAHNGEPSLAAFQGKVAGIMSASASGHGGMRGLPELRRILGNINVIVVTEQSSIPSAQNAFDEEGRLKDEKQANNIRRIGVRTVEVSRALIAARG